MGTDPSLAQAPTPPESLLADMDLTGFPATDMFHLPCDPALDKFVADMTFLEDNPLPYDPEDDLVLECLAKTDPENKLIYMGRAMPLLETSRDGWEPLMFVLEERLRYTLEEVRKAPQMMARNLSTPWSHSLLYKQAMPKIMRGEFPHLPEQSLFSRRALMSPDAHACCSMYQFKSPTNGPVIMRSLESYAEDLVDSPVPETPLETLARTQALILYCIIGVFDGDIVARARAECRLNDLEASARDLLPHVVFDTDPHALPDPSCAPPSLNPGEMPLFPLQSTEAFWRDWIFQESARRTLLFSFHLIVIYDLMTQRHTPVRCYKHLTCKKWTMSAHLWGAPSAVDFAFAWQTRRHFVMSAADETIFDEVVRDGRADDFETFGKMFLTAYMGVTQAKGWFLSRGGVL
jgi:hypothetical protein